MRGYNLKKRGRKNKVRAAPEKSKKPINSREWIPLSNACEIAKKATSALTGRKKHE